MRKCISTVIFLLVTALAQESCNQSTSYDYEKFGKSILKDLSNADTTSLKTKSYIASRDSGKIIKSYCTNFPGVKVYRPVLNYYTHRNIKNLFKNRTTEKLIKKDPDFIKVDVDTIKSEINLKVFYKFRDTFNYFTLKGLMKLNDGWNFVKITKPTNNWIKLRNKKNKWKRLNLNQPSGIYVKRANWQFKRSLPKRFKNFKITIDNNCQYKFEQVKFRVKIYTIDDYQKEVLFNQKEKTNSDLSNSEILRFEVPGLRDFYVGKDLRIERKWGWEAEIISVEPVPIDTPKPLN